VSSPRRTFDSKDDAKRLAPQVAARRPVAASASEGPAGGSWGFTLLSLAIVSIVSAGWLFRERLGIHPGYGGGYWLGIAGVSCVGILLIYPIRKRIPALASIGSVPFWFHFHMSLGLIAPVLILFHARFAVGSMNAAVALTTMLIVAGSGVVGRVLYGRIHRGLHGQKSEARAMVADAAHLRLTLIRDFREVADIVEDLEREALVRQTNVFGALVHATVVSARVSSAQHRMLRAVSRGVKVVDSLAAGGRAKAQPLKKHAFQLVRAYCKTLKRAAYLEVFERLFSLWHVVHLPLFFIMLVAAVIHVVAVHLY